MGWAETERSSMVSTLRAADPDAPTLCAGWDTRHLLAHLVQREHSPAASVGDRVVRRKPGQERFLGRLAAAAEDAAGYAALVARFEAGPPRWSPMSWAGDSINLVEYVVHHEDVRRGNGPVEPRVLPAEQEQALVDRLGTLSRLTYRKSPVGVTLTVPGGASSVAKAGTGVTLAGQPVELALFVTGRRAAADVEVAGPAALVTSFETWLSKN
jgi:uncharacterized protein (TIGR03085 family)